MLKMDQYSTSDEGDILRHRKAERACKKQREYEDVGHKALRINQCLEHSREYSRSKIRCLTNDSSQGVDAGMNPSGR